MKRKDDLGFWGCICVACIFITLCSIATIAFWVCWNHGVIYINQTSIHPLSLWHAFLIMMALSGAGWGLRIIS